MNGLLKPDEVYVTDDVTLADIVSPDDCVAALLTLARDINRIEEQLGRDEGNSDTADWADRAESAIRFKKSIRTVLTDKLADLRRAERQAHAQTQDRALIATILADWPEQFRSSLDNCKLAHPDLWAQ